MSLLSKLRARRRYREMSRLLAELDRLDAAEASGRVQAAAPDQATAGRPRITRVEIGYALGIAGIVVVLVVLRVMRPDEDGTVIPDAPSYASRPPTAAARVLPVVVPGTSGPHKFLYTLPDGTPVTYDPCQPIPYVINPSGMPDRGLAMVREAILEISEASGLAFTEEGFSDEVLAADRQTRQPQRYGERWAPVLISWTDEEKIPELAGDVTGFGGSALVAPTGPGSERFVTGNVALDRDWFAHAVSEPGGYATARRVVIHELGHVVGLDHVADASEIMSPSDTEATALGPGDRQGLAAAGAGRCHSAG